MKTIITLIMIISGMNLFPVFDDYEPSPRARAMGGVYYSISDDANAIFYNPAGLSLAENNLCISYTRRFGNDFETLNNIALTMDLPKKLGTLGFGLQAFDVDYMDVNLMSEKIYALAHSFTILSDVHSKIYVGYAANMYHLSINSFGSQPTFGINAGALAILHQRTRLGFTFSNINNPRIGADNLHELPQKLALGLSYIPYEDVITSVELKKSLVNETEDSGTELHAGTEVKVYKMFFVRFGIRNNPTSYSMGARFSLYNIMLDYAFNTHTIGNTHHFGIGYRF